MENPFSSATNTSSMRIAMFICVIAAVVVAILSLIWQRDLMGTAALVTALLGPAFGGKAAQSFAEARSEQMTSPTKPVEFK